MTRIDQFTVSSRLETVHLDQFTTSRRLDVGHLATTLELRPPVFWGRRLSVTAPSAISPSEVK